MQSRPANRTRPVLAPGALPRAIVPLILAAILLFLPGGAAFAEENTAGRRAPNIVIIVADDMGYSDIGCYGSEIRTPNLDRLAAGGLRFTQFYNTARCWPTRGSLLTGYYAQQVGMDPQKNPMPFWARLLPERLRPLGYRSYQSGKWHVPGVRHAVADGGFDRSYILDDHDRFFHPTRHRENDEPLPPVEPGSGYYSTTAIAEHAIRCLRDHAEHHAEAPFFSYVAFLAPHFPLHAPQEDIDRYRDRYDAGWEALRAARAARQRELGLPEYALAPPERAIRAPSGRPSDVEKLGPGEVAYALPWDELSDEQKRFQAAKMAIHAAMIDRIDQEVGRIVEQIKAMGAFDDTAVFFLSDNGASAEILVRGGGHDPEAPPGSAASYLCLGPGWSTACNTPFRRHKIWTHEGGISTPLVVHWPKGIAARGALRHAPGHVVDLAPTVLELAGAAVEPPTPEAPPMPGRSLVAAFEEDVPIERDYLFFHHSGNRGLRVGDWKIVSSGIDGDAWELYDLARDRGETDNLAVQHPERVAEMAAQWKQLDDEFRKQAAAVPPEPKEPEEANEAGKGP